MFAVQKAIPYIQTLIYGRGPGMQALRYGVRRGGGAPLDPPLQRKLRRGGRNILMLHQEENGNVWVGVTSVNGDVSQNLSNYCRSCHQIGWNAKITP